MPLFLGFKKTLLICGIIVLVLLPLLRDSYIIHVMTLAFMWGLLASSWDLLGGYTGQVSFGHATFFAIGAYSSGLLSLNFGINPWIGLLLGAIVAAMFGLAVGFPSLRLTGHYLALVTLGFSETTRVILYSWDNVTGGPDGIGGWPTFPGIPMPVTFITKVCYYYLALSILFVSAFILYRIGDHSSIGLCFKAIREDDVLAEERGINTTFYKLFAFTLSSSFAGLAGGFYAYYILFITPIAAQTSNAALVVSMAVIGGMGTIIGPVIGGLAISVLYEGLRVFGIVYNLIVLGLLVMLVIIFFPKGIVGSIKR